MNVLKRMTILIFLIDCDLKTSNLILLNYVYFGYEFRILKFNFYKVF